jgi:predicted RNA polymerase sigma factor
MLKNYHLLPTVRGDLLEKLGRRDQARAAFESATALMANKREREMLRQRAARTNTARR